MNTHISAAVALASVLAVIPVSAHHTARYLHDVDKPVPMKGTVTDVEWKNPHVIVHVDVKATDGPVVNWSLEARAMYIMRRNGFSQDFMKAGDTVEMTVCVALDGAHQAEMKAFVAPDGVKLVGQC